MRENYFTHWVTPEEKGYAIGTLLRRRLHFSRNLLRRLRDEGRVRLNNSPVSLKEKVNPGDLLAIDLVGKEQGAVTPEALPLEIIYEDQDLLVVNKGPGMVVHPTPHHPSGTLANGVIHYWQAKGLYQPFRPVHRLDRDTSGLLVIAANAFAHQQLSRQQISQEMSRQYIAVAQGQVYPDQGAITLPVGRKPGSIIERMVTPEGQEAITHYRVVERFPLGTILHISLETGRTHQIRVHLSHLGHPLWGDSLYGGRTGFISRQALHSYRVSLIHPRRRERLDLTCPLPADMEALINRLRS